MSGCPAGGTEGAGRGGAGFQRADGEGQGLEQLGPTHTLNLNSFAIPGHLSVSPGPNPRAQPQGPEWVSPPPSGWLAGLRLHAWTRRHDCWATAQLQIDRDIVQGEGVLHFLGDLERNSTGRISRRLGEVRVQRRERRENLPRAERSGIRGLDSSSL